MNRSRQTVLSLVATYLLLVQSSAFANSVIFGKNEWLFDKFEILEQDRESQLKKTIALIEKFNGVLRTNGIHLIVSIVPIKMRVYQEFLPDNLVIGESAFLNYGQIHKALTASGVPAVNLNHAFLTSASRVGETPLFFRLDSHWTPTGVLVAANAIKDHTEADPAAKQIVASIPEVGYSINAGARKRNSQARDLVSQLPAASRNYVPDQVTPISLTRAASPSVEASNSQTAADIGLVGSSFSRDWFGFADALRYTLQRDVVSAAVGADQGAWVGMESFLRSDAFQTNPPKLLIWELPERDLHAPPDYRYREAKYVISNANWLKRVTELVKKAAPVRKR